MVATLRTACLYSHILLYPTVWKLLYPYVTNLIDASVEQNVRIDGENKQKNGCPCSSYPEQSGPTCYSYHHADALLDYYDTHGLRWMYLHRRRRPQGG